MYGEYLKNLYSDSIDRYVDTSKVKKLNSSTWLKSNRYIKISGIQSNYYKTTERFRTMYGDNKGVSMVVNTLNAETCMVTMFDTDMRILMRFKQRKEDINNEILIL